LPRRTAARLAEATAAALPESPGAEPYILYEQVGHLLRRAHQRATVIFGAGIGKLDLTPLQFAALVAINERGTIGQNALGRATAMDPATVLGVIRRLVAKRLVACARDPGDGRKRMCRLTPTGQRLIPQLLTRGKEITNATLAPLNVDEQRQFLELLKRLV